jgi:hypothetical protein
MTQERTKKALADLRENGFALIEPELIVGFRIGQWLDLDAYLLRGMPHPKTPSYYGQLADLAHANPALVHVFESLKTTGKMDIPVTLWPYEHDGIVELMCIDGATRLSCVGLLRAWDTNMFQRIPATLIDCDRNMAEIEMVRRNVLVSAGRALDASEFADAVIRMRRHGWSDSEIRKHLGISPKMGRYLNRCLELKKRGTIALQDAVRARKIPFYNALRICRLSPLEQHEILSKIDNTPVADLPRMKIWQSVPQEARTPLALANAADAFRRDVEKALAMHGKLDDEKLGMLAQIGKETAKLRRTLSELYL